MKVLSEIGAVFKGWADLVATAIVAGLDRMVSPALVRLVEQDDGAFLLRAPGKASVDRRVDFANERLDAGEFANVLRGSRMEISLRPSHFLFRTLELPAQAGGFLEGIVRAQIDRLTPWSASNAVFGCSSPKALDAERIATTVAVTTRPRAMAYVKAALAFRPASVSISTEADADAGRVKVFEQKARGLLNVQQVSRALLVLLAVLALGAASAVASSFYFVGRMDAQRDEVLQQIARRQMAMRAGASSPERAALQVLERRKHEIVPATLAIEALSLALPDNTYVTELHLGSGKLQVAGISADAPSLIRLIEQSPTFTRATFFAPTTRSASDPGERFHIEVRVEPASMVRRP